MAEFLKQAVLSEQTTFEQAKQADPDFEESYAKLWLKYAMTVNDAETVYRHMFQTGIGSGGAALYFEWALFLEKYRRNFDAVSIVYQEGLKRVQGETQEEVLKKKYTEFAERMNLRIKRDVTDVLSQSGSSCKLLQEQNLSPQSKNTRKKRTYAAAFGDEDLFHEHAV